MPHTRLEAAGKNFRSRTPPTTGHRGLAASHHPESTRYPHHHATVISSGEAPDNNQSQSLQPLHQVLATQVFSGGGEKLLHPPPQLQFLSKNHFAMINSPIIVRGSLDAYDPVQHDYGVSSRMLLNKHIPLGNCSSIVLPPGSLRSTLCASRSTHWLFLRFPPPCAATLFPAQPPGLLSFLQTHPGSMLFYVAPCIA